MANARKQRTLAERADRYRLYQLSVQGTDADCDFFEQAYADAFDRKPHRLWEDFAGAFAVCCEWVKRGKKRTAVAVDLDPEPLAWGRKHNRKDLPEKKRERIEVIGGNCLDAALSDGREPADVVAAQNFSFWIFRTRAEVIAYFRVARSRLGDEGVLVLDMMGGTDCTLEENVDERAVDGAGKPIGTFTYLWEQVSFNPITHDAVFRIGFRFRDGSSIDEAFRYEWRFWSIPEVARDAARSRLRRHRRLLERRGRRPERHRPLGAGHRRPAGPGLAGVRRRHQAGLTWPRLLA